MEPMEVLHQIVAADRQARLKIDRAQGENRAFDGNFDKLRRDLADQAMAQAEKDVVRAREEAIAQAGQQIEQLQAQFAVQLEELTARFQARREQTVEKMFRMTVGLL